MVARMRRCVADPGPLEFGAAVEDVIKTRGGKPLIRRQRDALRKRFVLPAPVEATGEQLRRRFFGMKARIVRRGVEIAADYPGDRADFLVGIFYRSHVIDELANRLAANCHVFVDFAAVTFEM